MKRWSAWALVLLLIVLTVAGLMAPPGLAAFLAVGAALALRRGRITFLGFAAAAIVINVAILALVIRTDGFAGTGADALVGPVGYSLESAKAGAISAIRLVAIAGANLAVLSWIAPQRIIDGLGLPPRATALLAAILILAHDLGRDFERLVAARRLDGTWPKRLRHRLVMGVGLLPPLVVMAVRRATVRREALRLAGHDTGPRFAPIAAIAALAVAGRLVFIALPNVAFTYVVVFIGGVLYGPLVGAAAGGLSMLVTNLLLTGLLVVSFANVPAMALVGAAGGLFQRPPVGRDPWSRRILAACIGFVATMVFSVAADVATYAIVPEIRSTPGALERLILAGLLFNLVPGFVNAMLFGMAVEPVRRAMTAAGLVPGPGMRHHPPEGHTRSARKARN